MSKPKTKYDCPFYEANGGHCKKKSYELYDLRLAFGCSFPNDISRCYYLKKMIKDNSPLKDKI